MTASRPATSTGLPFGLALLVAGALFMEILDGTIVSTAAPRIARSFDVAPVDIHIVSTVYLLTLAVAIPVSRWAADRFGARRIFLAAIVIFTVASVLCAASVNLHMLTAVRVLQGIGGAMMVPVGRLVVMRDTPREDVIRAVAFLTWPALAAPVLAPALGGVITEYASWRWIFLINVPLGVIALIAALRLVPASSQPRPPALDWTGFLLSGFGLGLVTYAAGMLESTRIQWVALGSLAVLGALFLTAAIRHLLRAPSPLIDLRVLRIATVRRSAAGGSWFRMVVSAVPFLLPLMFQAGFGWSPVRSGLLVMALFAGNIGIKPITTPALRRLGFRNVLLLSGLGLAATVLACGFVTADTPLAVICVILFLSGAFRSIGFSAYNTIAFADTDSTTLGDVNTLMSTAQQLMAGLGIAVAAIAVRLGGALDIGAGTDAARPYQAAFLLIDVLMLLALADALRVDRQEGAAIGGGGLSSPMRR
jgi:EmrB/QacA subfamily drug resistance transporter